MAWNRTLLTAKLKAVAAHLGISAVLVGIALALMMVLWFPAPLYATDGGGTGLKLLLLVDLVLGPLLTFVVFNPAKRRRLMVIDLGVIAALQLAGYGAGLYSIHSVRVQALAFYQGQFQSVTAQDFKSQEIAAGGWTALGDGAPYLVAVRKPETGEEQAGVLTFEMTTGLAPFQLHFLYQPLASAAPEVLARGWTMAELEQADPLAASIAGDWARGKGFAAPYQRLRFYRVEGFYDQATLVLDTEGRWLGGYGRIGKVPRKPARPAASP